MGRCNEERKTIQSRIVTEARAQARDEEESPILFLGGDWHSGVVGIAASKICEEFWKPTWLFQKKEGICKGSARSIPDFHLTETMQHCSELFTKFGGHKAAAGFTFPEKNESLIKEKLTEYCTTQKNLFPDLWKSKKNYDCDLPLGLIDFPLIEVIAGLKPFGNGFNPPLFRIEGKIVNKQYYLNKTTGAPKHTAIWIGTNGVENKKFYFLIKS
jgi:single-stranded-DNA-specific exonuclease